MTPLTSMLREIMVFAYGVSRLPAVAFRRCLPQ